MWSRRNNGDILGENNRSELHQLLGKGKEKAADEGRRPPTSRHTLVFLLSSQRDEGGRAWRERGHWWGFPPRLTSTTDNLT